MDQDGTRINKYLSEQGICSRREADKWIELGRVTVNGKRPTAGTRVMRRDSVRVDGRVISKDLEPDVYIALNKPPGIVCTMDIAAADNIAEYVNYPKRIFPIGRLDKPSEGLIFLTSDGDIVNKILRAGNEHEKEYEVTVDKFVTPEFVQKMATGVPIMGTMTKKCKVEAAGANSFRIVLVQGMNRQIRRMCEHFGYDVKKLKRTRIMNVTLDMPVGQWRELTDAELSEIQRMTRNSSKVHEGKSKKPSAGSSNAPRAAKSTPPKSKSNAPRNAKPAPRGSKPASRGASGRNKKRNGGPPTTKSRPSSGGRRRSR